MLPEMPNINCPVFSYNAGVRLIERDQYIEAEKAFRMSLEIDSSFALSWSALGAVLTVFERPHEAREAFCKALEHDPSCGSARFGYGTFLKQQGRYEEAEVVFRTALRLEPSRIEVWINLRSMLIERG